MQKCKDIFNNFCIDDKIINILPYGSGHINDTFLVECEKNKYILQRINHNIFKKPHEVMENIINICNHIREKIELAGGDTKREVLNFVKAKNGTYLCEYDGNYYRAYVFVDGVHTYQSIENPLHFYNAGKAFGKFQNMLADFDADKLHETIVDFHNTQDRYEKFLKAVEDNKAGRAHLIKDEIEFINKRKDYYDMLVRLLADGDIPLRVTHNDTKLNNILIDTKTDEAICVIDLDTVMPATLLYDFGDAIRFGTNTAAEDEKDLSKVNFDISLFEKFAQGFIEEMKDSITPLELQLLPFSAILITMECGIRFATDYLDGDVYFKIHRDGHNLDRARTQFKLVLEMEKKEQEMIDMVTKIYNDLKN